MPKYVFRDTEEGVVWEDLMSMDEKDRFLEANPEIEILILKAPALVGGIGGIRTDEGFKELLSKISDAHPTSELAKDHGKKDAKSVKIRDVIDKKRKKAGIQTTLPGL